MVRLNKPRTRIDSLCDEFDNVIDIDMLQEFLGRDRWLCMHYLWDWRNRGRCTRPRFRSMRSCSQNVHGISRSFAAGVPRLMLPYDRDCRAMELRRATEASNVGVRLDLPSLDSVPGRRERCNDLFHYRPRQQSVSAIMSPAEEEQDSQERDDDGHNWTDNGPDINFVRTAFAFGWWCSGWCIT